MSRKLKFDKGRVFKGALYNQEHDETAGRSERAWNDLGVDLKYGAEGLRSGRSRIYFPHEAKLTERMRA